jgi:hypothetical protein
MKRNLLIASSLLVAAAAIIVKAQNLPPNFGTPQGTNALAASAGFVDILGIKLGMPAEEALATLKASYPASKITLARTPDYESAWYTVERENPSHKWVHEIDVDPNGPGDKISVGLSLPPSKQVVHSISRATFLKEAVAVENIVAALRKKYGPETYGVDYRMGGITRWAVPLTVELRKSRWEHVPTKPPPSIALRAGPWWSCVPPSSRSLRRRASPVKREVSPLPPQIGHSSPAAPTPSTPFSIKARVVSRRSKPKTPRSAAAM